MKARKRILISITTGVICLAIIFFSVKWIVDLPYRNQIPNLPDINSVSPSLKEQLTEAYQKAHRNPTSENLGMLGMVYHSSAYYDKATQCYKLAVQKNSSEWIWSYYLGYLNQEMGESKSAIDNFTKVVKQNPKNYHALYYLGENYRNMGVNDKAEVMYNLILNQPVKENNLTSSTRIDFFPLQTYATFQLARIYSGNRQFTQAEKKLKEILRDHISFGAAYRILGDVYRLEGDTVKSKYYIVRANDLANYTPPVDTIIDKLARISRSELYLLRQIDEAVKSYNPEWTLELLNNALRNIPENKNLISKAVKTFLILDFSDQASLYLEKHLNYFKYDYNELKEVADLLFQKGLFKEADKYYRQAVALKPDQPDIRINLYSCFWEEGHKNEAIQVMVKLLENNKDNKEVLVEGVNFMLMAGEHEKLQTYLNWLKQISPNHPKVLKLTAEIAEQQGNPDKAVSLYEKAYMGDKKDLSTVQNYGNLLIRQNKWKNAINLFRNAMEYHPNDPYLLERLGSWLLSCPDPGIRNYTQAREYSERAFINIESSPVTLISAGKNLAMSFEKLGDKQSAYKYINITANLAKSMNAPADIIAGIENLEKQYSNQN